LLFAVSENLIGLRGKSVSFETILKASMAWKAGQLILPRGFSDLILPFVLSSSSFLFIKAYAHHQIMQLETLYLPQKTAKTVIT